MTRAAKRLTGDRLAARLRRFVAAGQLTESAAAKVIERDRAGRSVWRALMVMESRGMDVTTRDGESDQGRLYA